MDLNRKHEDWEKEAPMLAGTDRKNPFTVPEDYFESLKSNIEASIKAEELKSLIKADGFTVPESYFEGLEAKIKDKISAKEVIDEKPRVRKLRWIAYAAAACISFAVGTGVLLSNRDQNLDNELHRIPDNEIVQYLQLNSDAGDTAAIIDNLGSNVDYLNPSTGASEEELEQYINSTIL